jgi:hypothetical protein
MPATPVSTTDNTLQTMPMEEPVLEQKPRGLTRRGLLGLASAAVVYSAVPAGLLARPAEARAASAPSAAGLGEARELVASLDAAYAFQNLMMDAYANGSTVRLAQSYSDEALGATAFTYDNAVSIHAYLSRGTHEDQQRAEVLGTGLLYAQAHNFPVNDGRFAQGYFVNVASADGAFVTSAAYPYYFYTSAVGDQAWAGMALAQLFYRTHDQRYLAGAERVANWIVTNAYNTQGPGGFSFGTTINSSNQSVPSTNGKSTEHNIDCYAFFTMLAKLTKGGIASNGMSWADLAQHALQFCVAMYNSTGPYFYTGTLGDQVSINVTPIPEDCQTWSYMAALDTETRGTIDWALRNLVSTDTASAPDSSLTGSETVRGLVFDTASLTTTADDPQAVWLEGTSHAAAALAARVLRGGEALPTLLRDLAEAVALLGQCTVAQQQLGVGKMVGGKAIPAGLGMVAATSVMDTGFGYTYGPSLHIGATGWFLLAGLAGNPFQLGYRVVG